VSQISIFRVNVLNSVVNTILAYVLAREFIAISGAGLERHSEVHVVYIFFSPLAEVSDKSVYVVSLGHLNRTVLVELYTIKLAEYLLLISSIKRKVMYSLSTLRIRLGLDW